MARFTIQTCEYRKLEEKLAITQHIKKVYQRYYNQVKSQVDISYKFAIFYLVEKEY